MKEILMSDETPGSLLTDNPAPAPNPTPVPVNDADLPEWAKTLPDDIKSEPSIKMIKDIPSLAKSYVHAQKAIGADKIPIPGKHATEEDWIAFAHKAGCPKEEKEYQLELPKDIDIDEKLLEGFRKEAHRMGIFPRQAQALFQWWNKHQGEAMKAATEESTMKQTEEVNGLKREWGSAFQKNLLKAQFVVKKYADEDTVKYLQESGLGNNVKLVKMFSKIADLFKEDTIEGIGEFSGRKTPAEALQEANSIISDFNHPYHLASHPNHKTAVEHVNTLFQQASAGG